VRTSVVLEIDANCGTEVPLHARLYNRAHGSEI
jgi:hypothetical protein